MFPRLAAVVLLVSLPACRGKTVCGPYRSMNLPGVVKVDGCDVEPDSRNGLAGETTATGAELLQAIAAEGFELGRDGDAPFGPQRDDHFVRREGVTYRFNAALSKRPSGANFFYIVPDRRQLKSWVPEASWQRVVTLAAARAALVDRFRRAGDLATSAEGVPAVCGATIGELDPALAKDGASPLVNATSTEFKGAAGHGPRTFDIRSDYDPDKDYSAPLSRLIEVRTEIDRLAARRVVPVLVIKEYKPVKRSEGLPTFVLVSGGEATFAVAVVDLEANRVLCHATAAASITDKSAKPPKDAPTIKGKDGKVTAVWLEEAKEANLDLKISSVVDAQLARMSSVFAH